MNAINVVDVNTGMPTAGAGKPFSPNTNISETGFEDAASFQDAISRQLAAAASAIQPGQAGGDLSLGKKLVDRATGLADGMKHDQQYVSKMLEQATRTGDQMQLMKAMMALSDYQIKVQTISKTVSKAASALDQLTKLQ